MNFETGGILASYIGAIMGFIALLAYVIFLPTTQRNVVYLIVIAMLGVPFVVVLANSPGKLGQGLAGCFLLVQVYCQTAGPSGSVLIRSSREHSGHTCLAGRGGAFMNQAPTGRGASAAPAGAS